MIFNDSEVIPWQEISLSAEVSEWLFFIRFWDEFNKKFETFFGQYEEEYLPKNLAVTMVKSLTSLIIDYQGKLDEEIKFRYGWNEKKEELYCVVSTKKVAEEISSLIKLMENASTLNSDVYCQL